MHVGSSWKKHSAMKCNMTYVWAAAGFLRGSLRCGFARAYHGLPCTWISSRTQSLMCCRRWERPTLAIGLKSRSRDEMAEVSATSRRGGPTVQVLHGIRVCLAGVLLLIPEVASHGEVSRTGGRDAARIWTTYKEKEESSNYKEMFAWLVALVCGMWVLKIRLCTRRPATKDKATPATKDKATQTKAKDHQEWMELTIDSLRVRCNLAGLGTAGTKEAIATMLERHRELMENLSGMRG